MAIKNLVGRPPKVTLKTINKPAGSIQHNYSVSDACKYARISRDTYYRYLKNETLFREKMAVAQNNQSKVSFNFRKTY